MGKIKLLLGVVIISCIPITINILMNFFGGFKTNYEPGVVILRVQELKYSNADSMGSVWHERVNCKKLELCSQDIVNSDILGTGGSNYKISYFNLSEKECKAIVRAFKAENYSPVSATNCSKWFNRNGVDVSI